MGLTKPSVKYEHPRKRGAQVAGTVSKTTISVPKEKSDTGFAGAAIKKKGDEPRVSASSYKKDAQIRLVIYPPVTGQLPLYDEMISSGVAPNKALLGLLKKGFPKFEADLLAGKVTVPATELETNGKPVDTTRNVSAEFMNLAKDLFDPYDILSDRALGQRVAEAIVRSITKVGRNG